MQINKLKIDYERNDIHFKIVFEMGYRKTESSETKRSQD